MADGVFSQLGLVVFTSLYALGNVCPLEFIEQYTIFFQTGPIAATMEHGGFDVGGRIGTICFYLNTKPINSAQKPTITVKIGFRSFPHT
ncbi:hypothetical protein [Neisseria iguanae]|uniref:hypothetical protein n=1 Tax=Neisseria iguanae TaxID=90242 RepID=UPI0011B2073E|nr:hypothetical protein [Neisseria iguanae]